MTTAAPSAANSLAIPAPIPFDAPVTTATFPFSFPSFILLLSLFCSQKLSARHEDLAPGQKGCFRLPLPRENPPFHPFVSFSRPIHIRREPVDTLAFR